MNRTIPLLTLFAAAALAGCDQGGQTIVQKGPEDTMAEQLKTAPPVELPPAITATHPYRCRGDNSLIYVDWLQDNKGVNVRTDKAAASTPLRPDAEGKPPFTAEGGYSLTGTAEAETITVTLPGKDSQTCRRG
jgi:hypothetical protein